MDQKMLFTIDPTQMALVFNMILLFMLACMMNSGMFCLSFWLSGVYFVCVYTLLEFVLLALKMAELFSNSTRFLFSLFWFISCMKFVCVYEGEKMEWEMCFTYTYLIFSCMRACVHVCLYLCSCLLKFMQREVLKKQKTYNMEVADCDWPWYGIWLLLIRSLQNLTELG